MSGKCSGLHCPGCGDGGGAGLIIAVIIGLVVIGSGAAARAVDRLLSAVETFLIIAAIGLGSAAVLIIGGAITYRSVSRARARARAPLYSSQPARPVVTLRLRAELPRGGSRLPDELRSVPGDQEIDLAPKVRGARDAYRATQSPDTPRA
jgi:hypothetical protein